MRIFPYLEFMIRLFLFSLQILFSLAVFAQPFEGTASFYANKFNGRKTASGEIFYNDSLTAAHKSLPFGTFVKVTNLKNDSVVIVKVNDRLPKNSKRSIDLAQEAARKLNFIRQGLTPVRIEVINDSTIVSDN